MIAWSSLVIGRQCLYRARDHGCSVMTCRETRSPSLIPTPANPMPSPRLLVLAATSWKRASSRRMPRPLSTIVSAAVRASVDTPTRLAPESRAFAIMSGVDDDGSSRRDDGELACVAAHLRVFERRLMTSAARRPMLARAEDDV